MRAGLQRWAALPNPVGAGDIQDAQGEPGTATGVGTDASLPLTSRARGVTV